MEQMEQYGSLMLAIIGGLQLGLVTVPHCFGMCGPLHLTVGLTNNNCSMRKLSYFNFGRVLGYTIIGIICGLGGSFISAFLAKHNMHNMHHHMKGSGQHGGAMLFLFPAIILFCISLKSFYKKPIGEIKLFNKIVEVSSKLKKGGPFSFGMLTSLLPCGMLYVAFATALGTGSPILGGAILLSFCLVISIFLQLGIYCGTVLNQKLKNIFERLFPWLTLVGAIIYISIYLYRKF